MNMSIFQKFHKWFVRREYSIGFLDKKHLNLSDKERFKKIKWVDLCGYSHGWFADPFIFSVSDKYVEVLAEEYEYQNCKGRLVCLTISRNDNKLISVNEILSLETHLSFPIFIYDNGKYYVYPENYESGVFTIYEFDLDTKKLINPHIVINEPLVDTQIIKLGEKYYAFGVIKTAHGHEDTKELSIYESDVLFGKYKLIQTIKNERKEERGAGMFYYKDGMLIRPAQSCEIDYGRELVFYEVNKNNGCFTEKEVLRMKPDLSDFHHGRGLHTFNEMNGIVVFDGFGFTNWRINGIIRKLLRQP